jgi:hypothetical protein
VSIGLEFPGWLTAREKLSVRSPRVSKGSIRRVALLKVGLLTQNETHAYFGVPKSGSLLFLRVDCFLQFCLILAVARIEPQCLSILSLSLGPFI